MKRTIGALLFPKANLTRALASAEAGQLHTVFPVLANAAKAGDRRAQYWVGKAYLEGRGVPHSRSSALLWLLRAGEAGDLDAQSVLAALYLTGAARPGEGPAPSVFADGSAAEPDYEQAQRWARPAAEAGQAEAQALLGYLLTSGPETMQNQVEADTWYRRSAESGCGQGWLGLALSILRDAKDDAARAEGAAAMAKAAAANVPLGVFLMGSLSEAAIGVERNLEAAARFYEASAKLGVRQGVARWGLALLEGRGVPKDPVNGESWLRRAALAGDAEAAALVGDMYTRGGDLPPNYAEAATWYTRAAENGHRVAARALAMLFLTGAGVARDPDEAARWFRVSAEQGDAESRGNLAQLVLQGAGKPEDRVRTREWFEEAAQKGDKVAAFNLGVCLAEGVGVERDDRAAAEWLRRAADGVVNAQFWYGRMLTEGRGVDANPAEGRHWIQRASEAGMVDAQVALAEMLVNGRGGPRDHATAQSLFQAAAEKGNTGAEFAIGAMLGGGHDVPMDRPAAQGWFERAAAKGHPFAQLMLGRYLVRSLAGTRDLVRGRAMLTAARAAGVAEAGRDLSELDTLEATVKAAPAADAAPVEAREELPAASA